MSIDEDLTNRLKELHERLRENALLRRNSTSHRELQTLISSQGRGLGTIRASLDDVQDGIIRSQIKLQTKEESQTAPRLSDCTALKKIKKPSPPFIKITLRTTDSILLYEQRSVTALQDTDEGHLVQEENKAYEELLSQPDRERHVRSRETQTANPLRKCRGANTEIIAREDTGAYVSNFDMFDTYRDLEKSTKSVDVDGQQQIEITTYKLHGVDQCDEIHSLPNFRLATMITMRVLAGNVFELQQRRFRNMHMPDPLSEEVHYQYRLELLWRYKAPPVVLGKERCKAVADLSWCPSNGDILAVAYGIYSYYASIGGLPDEGCVCIWSIKNPVNPERCYCYTTPTMCVEFSPFVPSLLAVGLYDGTVQVLDISHASKAVVATSIRSKSASHEPIVAIKWIPQHEVCSLSAGIQPLLALSRDCCVTRYTIITGPHLLAFQQISLCRVESVPEGLPLLQDLSSCQVQANRHPQGLDLVLHSQQSDVYYVLTDEGCLHRCSTNYPQQHLQVLQVHEAAVNYMEYSPWSPKLYLTCGNDWCVRIWLDGILQPIICLKHGVEPIHCAHWSKTHSTVLVSLRRDSVDVWDIRRSTLKPISTNKFDKPYHTLLKLSNCGRSVAVGNEAGDVLMLAFEDMPFPPYSQFKALRKAILGALSTDLKLKQAVKSFGYFGYPRCRSKALRKEI